MAGSTARAIHQDGEHECCDYAARNCYESYGWRKIEQGCRYGDKHGDGHDHHGEHRTDGW